ncbi:hypothetical protein RIR_e3320_jg16644.t1 [Rhizophagus irregularis DAOM 181602=DAOM 197198]|nr:hypothetical protein RIR_e3320_jg16644.t1 [Rhizophagus irregularis DAOM 181602=DAOM 197198]
MEITCGSTFLAKQENVARLTRSNHTVNLISTG